MCRSFKELKDFCLKDKSGKIFLIFHSYELMAVFWAVILYFHPSVVWFGLAFGMSVHLLLDQIFNPIYPLAYFLVYRMKLGFPKAIFFNEGLVKEFEQTSFIGDDQR